jgi:phage terminase large subunit-like protein
MNLRTQIAQARRQLASQARTLSRSLDVGRAAAWLATARPEQLLPPGPWRTWFIRAGRGWGKTVTGAQAVATLVRAGLARRIAIVARTEDDLRNVAIAALQDAYGPGLHYYPATHRLVFANGAIGFGFSAGQPDGPRGYEFDLVWFDELAAFPNPEIYDQFQFALRMPGARQIITTTPRPTPLIRAILADPTTHETTGRTSDNAVNLDRGSLVSYGQYEGTRLGRQELEGELLDELDGGLWKASWIDGNRVMAPPELVRTVVAIDPAVGTGRGSHEVGIVVAAKGIDGHAFVLADLSGRMGPDEWARRAAHAARFWGADALVAEPNNGGDLIRTVIEGVDSTLRYKAIRSSASKVRRAEPIAGWYELGRVHHVDRFDLLEDQLVTANLEHDEGPNDRLDALVLALTELELGASAVDEPGVIPWQYGVWPCVCGHPFYWKPNRPCPKCGTPAAATYDAPINRSTG